MEAASKNTPEQRRRGRPRLMSPALTAQFRALWSETKTDRHLGNKWYLTRALRLLRDDARFRWLYDPAITRINAQDGWRPSLLTELGRIADDDDLRMIAEHVCTLQPKTKLGVALIRRWRLGRVPAHGWLSLLVTLERIVNDYLATHREAPWDDVERALENLLAEVRELKEGSPH